MGSSKSLLTSSHVCQWSPSLCIWKCFSLLGPDENKDHTRPLKGFERNKPNTKKKTKNKKLNPPPQPWYLEAHTADSLALRLNANVLILQVQEDFDIQEFNKMCWTLCYKKNICTKHLVISDDDAFKVWCIFNFLSEDQYPLVTVAEEVRVSLRTRVHAMGVRFLTAAALQVEYFLQRLTGAMGSGWSEEKFAKYRLQLHTKSSLSAWDLIDLVGADFCKGLHPQTVSMGIGEVFQELILDVVKQVGWPGLGDGWGDASICCNSSCPYSRQFGHLLKSPIAQSTPATLIIYSLCNLLIKHSICLNMLKNVFVHL